MSSQVFPSSIRGLGYSVIKAPEGATIHQVSPSFTETRIKQSSNPLWHWELLYNFLIDNPLRPNPSLTYTDLQTMIGFYLSMGEDYDDFLFTDPTDNAVGPAMLSAAWTAVYPYTLGDIVIGSGHAQKVSVAPAGARSGFTQPSWNTGGGTTADGGLTWLDLGAALNGGTNWPNPKAQLQLITVGGVSYSPIQRNFGGLFYEDITDLNAGIVVYANGVLKANPTHYTIVGPGLAIPGYGFQGLVIQWVSTPTGPITATFNFYFRVRFEMPKWAFENWANQWWMAGGDGASGSDPLKLVTSRTGNV